VEEGGASSVSQEISTGLIVFLLAAAYDILIGEPPVVIHPVVWIGRLISLLRGLSPPTKLGGLLVAASVIAVTVFSGHLLVMVAGQIPSIGYALTVAVSAYLLKSTFAVRCLLQTSLDIGRSIDDDISRAKDMLPALVGRETKDLTRSQAASAVIESLSENYVDGILSPIFYFLVFEPVGLGLEAALAFKAISTMDSMLGYKTKGLKDLGLVPARLDDLANLIPARLSTLFLAAANPRKAKNAIMTAFRYHRATPSPNSGWPMSAAAGALGIRLEKPGFYVLLEEGKEPETQDIPLAVRLVGITIAITLLASILILYAIQFLYMRP
jgi:adenosylcobinamide-phosphate synthase